MGPLPMLECKPRLKVKTAHAGIFSDLKANSLVPSVNVIAANDARGSC